jgi:integrase
LFLWAVRVVASRASRWSACSASFALSLFGLSAPLGSPGFGGQKNATKRKKEKKKEMNFVKTITDEQADEIYRRLPKRSKYIFALGLETGLRISDMLRLKIKDLENPMEIYVSRIDKVVAHQLTQWLFEQLLDYAAGRHPDRYLFSSARYWKRKLHRTTYHRDIKQAIDGLKFSASAHSTRKYYLLSGI